jgi:4-amino-4-deoxy-L-arabinose transferase-like glycosyltransferase
MKTWYHRIPFALLPCTIYYFLFYKLGSQAFRIWDEARLATNAWEMSRTGKWIVTTADYTPDMWNTKPPLMIWAQALCIKLWGLQELSIRLPAAASAAITVLLVFAFVFKMTKNSWSAFFAALVLCTSRGYFLYHAARHGEYDSMLCMFTTGSLIAIFLYTETNGGRRNAWLLLFFVCLTGAVLTKSIAALLPAPGIFIYLLLRRQILSTLATKYLYAGILFFVIFALGYYELRELQNPGYIQAVFNNELDGRFLAVQEMHGGPWDFYWNFLRTNGFGVWYWIIPTSFLTVWLFPNRRLFRAGGFCLLTALMFIIIISTSKTKLEWYALPVFALLAIMGGILIDQLATLIAVFLPFSRSALIFAALLIFSIQPLKEGIDAIYYSGDDLAKNDVYAMSHYFRDAADGKRNLSNTIYVTNDYNFQWLLYAYHLNELGKNIDISKNFTARTFKPGDSLIANQPDVRAYIENTYAFTTLDTFYGVKKYLVTGVKQHL